MGYCYGKNGNRSCDVCGGVEEHARNRRCPYGYCPAPAICHACWEKPDVRAKFRKYHQDQNCKAKSEAWDARQRERERLLESGRAVRVSAMNVGDDTVHVLFARKGLPDLGFLMSVDTYRAVSLLDNATPEDFAKIGPIEEGPGDFDAGAILRLSKKGAMVR